MFDKKNRQLAEEKPIVPYNIPKKADRIQMLLQIRNIKNTYYKYTNNPLFRQELYESFLVENDFDSGASAYDDDEEIRIFDRYILQYIKARQAYLEDLVQSNEKYQLYLSISKLEECACHSDYHILFIIDMTDKKIFDYCYNIYTTDISNDFRLIDTLFSAIVYKDMNKYIKVFK